MATNAEIEQRVYELLGERKGVGDIADELGLDVEEATAVTLKVIDGRGTPSMVARRAALDRLSRMRVA